MISVIMGVLYLDSDISSLKYSIDSILNQSYTDLEFLICDDGSSQQAISYIDNVANSDKRIKVIRTGNKYHLAEKLNICLKEASGDYIARMDDDDLSHLDRLDKQLSFLKENPQIGFVGCNVNIRYNNEIIGIRKFPMSPEVKDFYFTQPYIHPTLLFRRDVILSVEGYSESKYCILCEDYDLLLRLYESGYKGFNIQEPLFDYTIRKDRNSGRNFIHRINEVVTRYNRFSKLGCLPKAFPYVIKPLVVGLIPKKLYSYLKKEMK